MEKLLPISAFMTLAFIAMVSLSSCDKDIINGDGPIVTETRSINGFTGVSTSIPGKINYTIDPVYKVEILAQQNILNVIKTEVTAGILQIKFPNYVNVRSHDEIIVNIHAPSASYVSISGVGNVFVVGSTISNDLTLSMSGSGNINMQSALIANKIDARISGSGNIKVTGGSAINEELHISGSGSIDMGSVFASNGDIHISGSGDTWVRLSQTLDASISGSGSVYYKGTPTITSHVSGSGSVIPF